MKSTLSLVVPAFLALLLPGVTASAELGGGAVPATKHQTDVLKQVPESATTRGPEARGTTVQDIPISPHQGQVLEGVSPRFAYFDINGDGHISASEAAADPKLESAWSRLDQNNDDQLDRSEFAGFEPKKQE